MHLWFEQPGQDMLSNLLTSNYGTNFKVVGNVRNRTARNNCKTNTTAINFPTTRRRRRQLWYPRNRTQDYWRKRHRNRSISLGSSATIWKRGVFLRRFFNPPQIHTYSCPLRLWATSQRKEKCVRSLLFSLRLSFKILPFRVSIRLGEHDLSKDDDWNADNTVQADPVVDIDVEEIIHHPQFSLTTLRFDIAVIRLKTPAPYSGSDCERSLWVTQRQHS